MPISNHWSHNHFQDFHTSSGSKISELGLDSRSNHERRSKGTSSEGDADGILTLLKIWERKWNKKSNDMAVVSQKWQPWIQKDNLWILKVKQTKKIGYFWRLGKEIANPKIENQLKRTSISTCIHEQVILTIFTCIFTNYAMPYIETKYVS